MTQPITFTPLTKFCQFRWSSVFGCIILIAAILVFYDFETYPDYGKDSTMDVGKVAASMVMRWPSKEKVALGSLWTNRTSVVFFMRRFG